MFYPVLFIYFFISANCADRVPHPREAVQNKGKPSEPILFPDDLLDVDDARPYHHIHHHYHHQEGQSTDTEGGHITDFSSEKNSADDPNLREIPVDFIQTINKYNITDLMLNYIEGIDFDVKKPSIVSRFGEDEDDNSERGSGTIAKSAACMPELQTVKLAKSGDPSILYIPQCTRIERCGGCCSHSLLSCQPSETETINLQVLKTQYVGGKKLKYVGKEIIPIEKHTKCNCDCKVKAKDCNRYQEYNSSLCKCTCRNSDEEKKCYKQMSTKLWDPEICACRCREITFCSTTLVFDQNECKCVPAISRERKYAAVRRKGSTRSRAYVPFRYDDGNDE